MAPRSGNSLRRRDQHYPRRLDNNQNSNYYDLDLDSSSSSSYLDSIIPPTFNNNDYDDTTTTGSSPLVLLHKPNQPVNTFGSIPSLSETSDGMHLPGEDNNGDSNDDDDVTWLVAVVLTTALLVTIASVIRSCGQKAGWLPLSMHSSQDGHEALHGGGRHGPGGGPSRYHTSGPHQVPSEDEPDPDSTLNEDDERWAQLTDAQRQAYTSARAFQAAHPPLSVPTDISLSQYLSIQEKGVSAWEFEAPYDNHRVQVHDRTELSFLTINQLETSVQTNLPMPKQQEVYYWEVKMFEKSPDTVVSVGVSTKPYPNTRMPGWNRHSVAYFSKDGQKYCNSPFSGHPYGPVYFEGDVIGCGYRPRTGTIFFTRNGKRLEDAYTGLTFNLFPTVGANGPCMLHVNLGQSGFVFVEANVKKWGLAPASGSLAPPPAYGSVRGSILLEAGSALGGSGAAGGIVAPPMRRPQLQSAQSRARIEAAGVLVQIDEEDRSSETGSGSEYSKKVHVTPQHISLSTMSAPGPAGGVPPPHYSSLMDDDRGSSASGGRTRSQEESDDETTALIAETISRPVGRVRSGTTSSTASGSGRRP
ncbi:Rsp5p-dependent ubiquitination, sorting of cargo proteins at the multivesicular body [Mortierella sp. AD031]|nr:Rsp5p-dependent ubiquitination, sorting of cargo proteins at the multivesicular body [Mortierella sp. AD031]KAG0200677.1 Rsp5p-dependent ubiquitination, sorting of cargo proteins at the multivesicular body [Mortierella sp. NVP41]